LAPFGLEISRFQGRALASPVILEIASLSLFIATVQEYQGYSSRQVAGGANPRSVHLRAQYREVCSMSFSMSKASIPAFVIGLEALSSLLEKAEAFAAAKKIDPSVLLNLRLAPDMFPLTRQVQIATDQAKKGSARLAGVEAPRYEDDETTLDQLKARLAKTIAYLKTLDLKKIDAAAEREISFPLGPKNEGRMHGADYLNHFVLPNFYFHLATAYDILRHCGVDIGKRDFLGAIPMRTS
jgi:uncharacterized protein